MKSWLKILTILLLGVFYFLHLKEELHFFNLLSIFFALLLVVYMSSSNKGLGVLTKTPAKLAPLTFVLYGLLVAVYIFYSVNQEGFSHIISFSKIKEQGIFVRREYLAEDLGKIYRNKYGMFFFDKLVPGLSLYTQRQFGYLDFSKLFRFETSWAYFFTALFLVGLRSFLQKASRFITIGFFVQFILLGLLPYHSNYGLYLVYHVVIFFIMLGAVFIYQLFEKGK